MVAEGTRKGPGSDLERITGIGRRYARMLEAAAVTSVRALKVVSGRIFLQTILYRSHQLIHEFREFPHAAMNRIPIDSSGKCICGAHDPDRE